MIKRIILIILTVLNLFAITAFSTQGAESSDKLSSEVTEKVVMPIIEKTNKIPIQNSTLGKNNNKIRSVAHFTLFLTLGVLMAFTLTNLGIKNSFFYAFAICAFYALFDEVYQELLQKGRAFEFVDLLKDWLGTVIGLVLSRAIILLRKNISIVFKL